MVDLESLTDSDEIDFVQVAVMKHATLTGSRYAEQLLGDWASVQRRMIKVMPREYKRALAEQAKQRAPGQDWTAPAVTVTTAVAAVGAEAQTEAVRVRAPH
jgi:glutamate synthase domain-containing protein 3